MSLVNVAGIVRKMQDKFLRLRARRNSANEIAIDSISMRAPQLLGGIPEEGGRESASGVDGVGSGARVFCQ